ncbi:MAG: C40 family peptidase [Chitinophagaceae bacterium]
MTAPLNNPVRKTQFLVNSTPTARFLDPILLDAVKVPAFEQMKYENSYHAGNSVAPAIQSDVLIEPNELNYTTPLIETVSPILLKYAILLDTAVEYLPDEFLLLQVDEWMGVRYRFGGTTKKGIDCSGFTATVFASYCGVQLPRTSKRQYETCEKVESDHLRAGDLLFFNTRGRGVSHVGIYLGNNKFIHASVSTGVMVSDSFESYYAKRFLGAGRLPSAPLGE